ncbi:hypothetical protein MHY85_14950 [Cellulomonas sp. ACRRI]|uniref:RCC1 domain-containing protein n=1 Tax=Cellulomonas sp. ACRRI TaxID=2918188 RepID=UPI001EF2DB3B|nr:hypothetical protein [Cellulomonas sp. ACRRI]MCG7287262.1 hypothetical protein [Cellulomonas sp. ACRRI]
MSRAPARAAAPHRTRARARRALAAVAGLLVVGLAATAVPATTAAYTDRATATTDVFRTPTTTFVPQRTYLNGTFTAVQDDGTLAIWGFRGNGLSGTGVATVAPAAAVTLLTLPSDDHPDGARRVIRTAGTSLDNYYPTDVNYTGIAALSDDGRVYTWGGNQNNNVMGRPSTTVPFNQPGQVDIPGTVVDLRSSSGVFMALTDTGDVYTWGNPQARGITGQGGASTSSATPTRILTGVHSIGAGMWNGWAIRGNTDPADPLSGVLWWGFSNAAGTLAGAPGGDNTTANANTPIQSVALSAYTTSGCEAVGVVANSPADTCGIRSLTGHYYGNQAILADGTVLGWGNASFWGTGRPSGTAAVNNTPTPVEMPIGARMIAPTEDYVLALDTEGYAWVWGRYTLAGGLDPVTGGASTTNPTLPTRLDSLGVVESVAGTGYTGAAVRADGSIALWGGGQTGGRNNTNSLVRNGFATTTTPTGANQGLTDLIMPGTVAATGATP